MLFKIFNLFYLLTIVSSKSIMDEYKSIPDSGLENNEDLYKYKVVKETRGWDDINMYKRIDNRNISRHFIKNVRFAK